MYQTERRDGRNRQQPREALPYQQLSPDRQLRQELGFLHNLIAKIRNLSETNTQVAFDMLPPRVRRALSLELGSGLATNSSSLLNITGDVAAGFLELLQRGKATIDAQVQAAWRDQYRVRYSLELQTAEQFFGAVAVLAQYDRDKLDANMPQQFQNNASYNFTAARIDFRSEIDIPSTLVVTRSMPPWVRNKLEQEEVQFEMTQAILAAQSETEIRFDLPVLAEQLHTVLSTEQVTDKLLYQSGHVDVAAYMALIQKQLEQMQSGIFYSSDSNPQITKLLQVATQVSGREFTIHGWKVKRTAQGFLLQCDATTLTVESVQRLLAYCQINMRG